MNDKQQEIKKEVEKLKTNYGMSDIEVWMNLIGITGVLEKERNRKSQNPIPWVAHLFWVLAFTTIGGLLFFLFRFLWHITN